METYFPIYYLFKDLGRGRRKRRQLMAGRTREKESVGEMGKDDGHLHRALQ